MNKLIVITLSLLFCWVVVGSVADAVDCTSTNWVVADSVSRQFIDPNRPDRGTINSRVYFPKGAQGCSFPMVVWGHSYMLSAGCYDYLWMNIVPLGYIYVDMDDCDFDPLGLPWEVGKDIAWTHDALLNESASDPSSPIYKMLNGKACAAGHSFGADGAIIASTASSLSEYRRDWTSLMPMAPPEPPVITPEKDIVLPMMIIAGTSDCLAPADTNADKIFKEAPSTCKLGADIINGTHCRFCEIPEIAEEACFVAENLAPFCSNWDDRISDDAQHSLILRYAVPFVEYSLKDKKDAYNTLLNNLAADTKSGLILENLQVSGCH